MKWKKFCDLVEKHNLSPHDLVWRGTLRSDREFVRTKVNYIAFRPFEKLDLSAKNSSTSTPLQGSYDIVRKVCYQEVVYEIRFHIEGGGEGTRLRYVGNDGDGSVQACIEHIVEWFEGCQTFRGKRIVWERVVKKTVCGSWHVGLSKMSLEIYEFPVNYRFAPAEAT